MPNAPVTIAVGTAWVSVLISIWLSVQALAQVHESRSIVPDGPCSFPVEVIEKSLSRLKCDGQSLKSRCLGLEAGDRVSFHEQKCVVEPGAMSAAMRLAVSLKLDLNQVKAQDLMLLKGIGPSLSRAIVDYRNTSGPFSTLDDLLKVRGIGKKRLSGLRKYLTCAKP